MQNKNRLIFHCLAGKNFRRSLLGVVAVILWTATSSWGQTDLKFIAPSSNDKKSTETVQPSTGSPSVELTLIDPQEKAKESQGVPATVTESKTAGDSKTTPKAEQKPAAQPEQKPAAQPEQKPTPPAVDPAKAPAEPAKRLSPADLLKKKTEPTVSAKNESATKPAIPSPANSAVLNDKNAPYDPIKENGEIFVGWEKPKAAIVLTGLLDGYIEPCGCAGMDRMKGGLSRRHTFINSLKEKGWNLFCVDAGQIANGFGVQEELKFDMAMNAFRLMNYDAISIGKSELRFPAYFLLTFTAPPSNGEESRLVSANTSLYAFNDLYTLPCKIVEREGIRIGITSVVFPDNNLQHRDENILIKDPEEQLKAVLPRLKEKKCDQMILVVHGTENEATSLAVKYPEFGIVITSDSPSVPPAVPKDINPKQKLIELGEKGKYAVVLGLYDDPKDPVRYQRVALDSRFKASDEIRLLMEEYQAILKNLITTKGYQAGLGLSPIESPKRTDLGDYVGSQKCESCHEESYRIWRKNSHSTAWNSLMKTAVPPRDFDPECISCHVVGWHGIENFPYQGGFTTFEQTPHLANVGCESCHGPGSKHMEAELGKDTALQDSLRKAMQLGTEVKKVCFSCHDADNSPAFDFDSYYPKIEHKENTQPSL